RLKCGEGADWRAAVPRANILADIAAEDVAGHPRGHRLRGRALELGGGGGNAPRGIGGGRVPDRSRRASIQASRAGTAAVRRGNIRGRDFFEIDIRQDRAEKEPRPGALVDQASVLADPAESRRPSDRALQHRPCVDVGFGGKLWTDPLPKPAD